MIGWIAALVGATNDDASDRQGSIFSSVPVAEPINVFNVAKQCEESTAENKVDLVIGAYRDDNGKSWVLPVVRKAEEILAADLTQNHEYLPVLGYKPFVDAATALLLGADSPVADRAFGVQCISGSGSLSIGAHALNKLLKRTVVYVSKHTWLNHYGIFEQAGFTDIRAYRYWDTASRSLDFDGMIVDLSTAPTNAVVVLHGCAHNETGCDPTNEQWAAISAVIKKRKLFVFFDVAYQGFASGNVDEDAAAIRNFAVDGHEMFIAQSFSKNFGLYNERVGNLVCVVKDASVMTALKSQIALIVRRIYSNPPNHGAKIVAMILTTPEMRAEWEKCLATMTGRIRAMRRALHDHVIALETPGDWSHITSQIGMFSYLGISKSQVAHMTSAHNVYLLKSSRISIAGLAENNVEHVARAIHDAVTNH